MDRRDLRKCELQERPLFHKNRDDEKEYEKEVYYFHKWFDGIDNSNDQPQQYAIIESESGVIKKINIDRYNFRFIGLYEGITNEVEKLFGANKSNINIQDSDAPF